MCWERWIQLEQGDNARKKREDKKAEKPLSVRVTMIKPARKKTHAVNVK